MDDFEDEGCDSEDDHLFQASLRDARLFRCAYCGETRREGH